MRYAFCNKCQIFYLIFLMYLNGVGGCERRFQHKLDASMDKTMPRIEKLFEETKVICFGRIVMRIPINATVVYGWAEVDSSIAYKNGYSNKIHALVDETLTEVEKSRKFMRENDFKRLPLFGAVIDGIVPGQKIVIGSKDRIGYSAKSFIPIAGDLFIQDFDSMMPEEDVVKRLNIVASRLKLRSSEEIPSEEGICIEGGFVPSEYQYERARIGIRLKEFSDVHLSIETHKNLMYLPEGNSPRLLRKSALQRASAAGLASVFERIEILRDQERKLSVWTGEEFAAKTPRYKESNSVHEFRFHGMGSINDSFHPELDIRLDSGVKGNTKAKAKPSITDEEALALWDKILPTIRLRQPEDATTVQQAVPVVPLGSVMKSGDICPQSGWWECLEKRKIEGERRRFFKAGDKLPPVLAEGGASLWHTLIGNTYQVATVDWKLLEHAPPLSPSVDQQATVIPHADNGMKEKDA